jgi:hypothetical protein
MHQDALQFKFRINVPKIIWQTGIDEYEDLKYPFNLNVKTWQDLNPDWEYRYASQSQKYLDIYEYADEELIELSKYLYGPFIADLWRYIMLYQHGGVYSDLDSINAVSLEILPTNVTSHECQTIVSNDSGYNNKLNSPIYFLNGEKLDCLPCLKFSELIVSGIYGQEKWLNNGGFAAIKNSKPLKNVLDEIKFRFKLFKEVHENNFDAGHEMLRFIVDCSAFEVGLKKEENLISKTFIYDVQSQGDYNGLKVFKDFFININSYKISRILFSDNAGEK